MRKIVKVVVLVLLAGVAFAANNLSPATVLQLDPSVQLPPMTSRSTGDYCDVFIAFAREGEQVECYALSVSAWEALSLMSASLRAAGYRLIDETPMTDVVGTHQGWVGDSGQARHSGMILSISTPDAQSRGSILVVSTIILD